MRGTRDENGCRCKEKEREDATWVNEFRAHYLMDCSAAQHSLSDHTKVTKSSADTLPMNMKLNINSRKHLEQSVVSREMNNRKNAVVDVPLSLFEMLNPFSSTINLTA